MDLFGLLSYEAAEEAAAEEAAAEEAADSASVLQQRQSQQRLYHGSAVCE